MKKGLFHARTISSEASKSPQTLTSINNSPFRMCLMFFKTQIWLKSKKCKKCKGTFIARDYYKRIVAELIYEIGEDYLFFRSSH